VRITAVRAAQPFAELAPQDWRGWLGQILVAVETDDGLVGYGMGAGGPAGIEVIHTVLRSLLVGEDATHVEGLWDRMYRTTLSYGQKGLALMAISGVDLALWDLRGKRANKPLVEVLGGQPGAPMPAYRTTGIDGVEAAVDEGFTSVKLAGVGRYDPHTQLAELAELVAAARRLVGSEVALMTDAAMGWNDPAAALAAAERLAEYDLGWLEEPLQADDVEGYAWLCERSAVPIAGGEHEYTARGFERLMACRAHRVYQPDVTWCGGLTELVKIYGLAREHGVRVCPHRGSEAWSLHAIAALDPEPLPESGRPWMDWVGGPPIVNGHVEVGSGPGFGLGLDPALLD
jgi:L-rhamnonate dehydratase